MDTKTYDTTALEWWYRSASILESHGGAVRLNTHATAPGTPDLVLTKHYLETFTDIVEVFDVSLMISMRLEKASPESPIDSCIDHLLFARSGARLHLRVDAIEGSRLDALK